MWQMFKAMDMKTKIFIPLLLIVLVGCSDRVVNTKSFDEKPCICNYQYFQYAGSTLFQDSCNKYNIGDTIK